MGLLPKIVAKKVEARPREVMVNIIGNDLAVANGNTDVDKMIQYWLKDIKLCENTRPDLIVLPEICDIYHDLLGIPGDADAKKRRDDWLDKRGNKILDAFREYASAHRTYIVYPTYRDRGNGHVSNCSLLIDREGDVIACYDKVYPTVGDIEKGAIPGTKPVIAQTDFGTMGFAICFDLNFWDLLDAYAPLRPNVMAFSSYYHGNLMQATWAYRCQSYFLGATIGTLEKNIVLPDGTVRDAIHSFCTYLVGTINTNYKIVHIDCNRQRVKDAFAKYGRKLTVHNNNDLGVLLLISNDPDLPVGTIIQEFGIETWDEYYARSTQARLNALK
ncbi:MAG: carbon-nitrogen hydrolase family protein [Victivallales bacterium]|nr:carbon-nitrogen hydrolase family protein [Victivallales bacterium]